MQERGCRALSRRALIGLRIDGNIRESGLLLGLSHEGRGFHRRSSETWRWFKSARVAVHGRILRSWSCWLRHALSRE